MSDSIELASWVALEGCFNFRDLGGYRAGDGRRLRTGQVFRSDGLQHLTEADLARLCDEIGLSAVIDLRSDDEVRDDGLGPIAERAEIHHIPLFPRARGQARSAEAAAKMPASMGELYFLMLTAAKEPIVQVVRLLSQTDAPSVFHCAAGKDRTGVISALLLSILGIPEQTIVADYALSRKNIDLINERLAVSENYQAFMQSLPDGAYDADPEAMRVFLERVRREHGSMLGWAEAAGIDAVTRERLTERLLEG
jgi:protein-tyrosine phosphatase